MMEILKTIAIGVLGMVPLVLVAWGFGEAVVAFPEIVLTILLTFLSYLVGAVIPGFRRK
jgi:hypothetical protein